ncbi:E3 ubiquitin/ISG15 ligase TRIM25-like [Parambassis ranga]|uniref:E3 ubiquitin/ISG15 ligase TRIM25-like n=1 Tax=Parambassis ranga TaxID=210632 RepID=A0A6P7HUF2_9TELE|nr:E3 ubiquitin/ISG15 ligase TRIM25-like [Parambassis ranga]XP_028255716.1 E3 ubiquitin/ISG15 ligase TRIM25-like [Parambassis ranga]
MATVEDSLSLLGLEEELTCSICLSPFDCPVSTPCGHNFCQECLLTSWKDSFSCPQCRTVFPTKPELKKNTVLTAVVEALNIRISGCGAPSLLGEKKKKSVIRCDTCMEAEAAQTCLTCMASFCEEHLRPHRENPIYSPHQLSEPVGDLLERICPDHHKLMEHFCSQHARLICSLCLQQTHRGCSFMSPEEQRNQKESDLREKLALLDGKIKKTEAVMSQATEMQSRLKEAADQRKAALAAVYQQIRDLLTQEEVKAQSEVESELEAGQTKLRECVKHLTHNNEKLRKAEGNITSLLTQSQTSAFLQASFEMPKALKFEPQVPRVNMDSKKVLATQTFATALKESLTEILHQPVEDRSPLLTPGQPAGKKAESAGPERAGQKPAPEQQKKRRTRRSRSQGRPPVQPAFHTVNMPLFSNLGSEPGWSPAIHERNQRLQQFLAAQKTNPVYVWPGAPGGTRPGSEKPKKNP